MTITGGSALPVVTSTDAPIGGAAIPVRASAPGASDRAVQGGPAQAVYVVSDAELASGAFRLAGGAAVPMAAVDDGRPQAGGRPIPVYIASGRFTPLSYEERVLALSPLAYWRLDEPAGTSGAGSVRDATGNGRTGTPTGITFGVAGRGVPTAARFDSTDRINVYSASLGGVFSGDEFSFSGWFKPSATSIFSDGTLRRLFTFLADANNYFAVSTTGSSNQLRYQAVVNGSTALRNEVVTPTTNWLHVAFVRSKARGYALNYLNGQWIGLPMPQTATFAGSLASAILGAITTGGANAWSGDMQDCAPWARALAPGEIAQLGQTAGLVVYEGDSLTAGAGQTPWTTQMGTFSGAGLTGYSVAIGGTTTAQMIDRFAANIAPLRTSGMANIAVLISGTNDAGGGADGATIYSRKRTWHEAARAAGFRTIATTTAPRGDNSAFNDEITAANALLVADHSFADGFVDLAANANLSNPNNTTYYLGDKVHWTTAGQAVAAGLMKPAIEALAG